MSEIRYDQNYKGAQGINFPEDGKVLYQQDFMYEQVDIAGEIIDRESDYFTPGVIEGFNVSLSATAGCVYISAGVARDSLGRRIAVPFAEAAVVPDLQTTILAVNHVWEFDAYILDGTNDTKYRRKHSYLYAFHTVGSLPHSAVQLFRIQRNGSVVTILEDLRIHSTLKNSGVSPVGSIVARLPGYFGNNSNGSFTPVSLSLPSNWKVCDGSVCNDPDSPIFNGANRHLPNLTDSRFIMGSTVAASGAIGGNAGNQVTLTGNHLPAHNHAFNLSHTKSGGISEGNATHSHWLGTGHNSGLNPNGGTHGVYITGGVSAQSPGSPYAATFSLWCTNVIKSVDAPHSHEDTVSFDAHTGNTDNNDTTGTAVSILPKYLTAAYIIRIK